MEMLAVSNVKSAPFIIFIEMLDDILSLQWLQTNPALTAAACSSGKKLNPCSCIQKIIPGCDLQLHLQNAETNVIILVTSCLQVKF